MKKLAFLFLAAAICCAAPAKAQVLNFDGITGCEVSVGNYYNGGTAGDGSGPGPNLGIVFSSNAITLQDFFAGGGSACNQVSNTGNMPSPPNGALFPQRLSSNNGCCDGIYDRILVLLHCRECPRLDQCMVRLGRYWHRASFAGATDE